MPVDPAGSDLLSVQPSREISTDSITTGSIGRSPGPVSVVPMASTIPATYMGMTTAGTVTAEWNPAAGELQILELTP